MRTPMRINKRKSAGDTLALLLCRFGLNEWYDSIIDDQGIDTGALIGKIMEQKAESSQETAGTGLFTLEQFEALCRAADASASAGGQG